MLYYYIVDNYKIQKFITPMQGSRFVELTAAQREFYLDNPNASVAEVRNCALNAPYVAPVQSLSEVKSDAIAAVDRKSRETMGLQVDTLELANAMTSMLFAQTKAAPAIYDTTKATETIEAFLTIGKTCRELYYDAVSDINDCTTAAEVAATLETYIESYDEIGD